MTNAGKITIGVLAAGAVFGAGYYFLIHKPKQDEEDEAYNKEQDDKEKKTGVWGIGNDSFPLKKGSIGGRVAQLQRYLFQNYQADLGKDRFDGKFGTKTQNALKKHRNTTKLTKDQYELWLVFQFDNKFAAFSGFVGSSLPVVYFTGSTLPEIY